MVRRQLTGGLCPIFRGARGLELIKFNEIKEELLNFVKERQNKKFSERIHAAWFCVSEGRKVEPAHEELIKLLAESIPVIVVITKLKKDNGFQKAVQKLLPEAKDVVRVNAIETQLDKGYGVGSYGLMSGQGGWPMTVQRECSKASLGFSSPGRTWTQPSWTIDSQKTNPLVFLRRLCRREPSNGVSLSNSGMPPDGQGGRAIIV